MAAPATDAPSSRVIDRLVRTLSGNKIKPVAQAPLTTTGSEKAMSMLKTKQKWPALARLKNLGKLKKSTKAAQHSAVDPHGSLPISPVAGDDSKAVGDSGKQALDPADLAQKVQDLTNTLQTPTPGSTHPAPKPHPPARGRDGRPIPPPGSTPIKDADLIALLQDASYMNGSEEEGRPSIWSILDSIGAPTRTEDGEGDGDGDENPSAGDVSVMVYAPLVPTANSKVELARTLTVDIDPSTSLARKPSLWTTMWPWSGKTAIPSVPPAPQDPKEGDQDDKGKVGQGKGGNAPIQRPVWVPSTTKISLQALWWGYRIYLPPPVIAILDSKEHEAVNIAAIITAALQFIFSHIPIAVIPLPLQPAVLLLQRIVPYLGYIGSFIAWSWNTIKSFDKGNGVVLTATWILPVALLPSTLVPPPTAPKSLSSPPVAASGQAPAGVGDTVPPDKWTDPILASADHPTTVDTEARMKSKVST